MMVFFCLMLFVNVNYKIPISHYLDDYILEMLYLVFVFFRRIKNDNYT